MIQDKINHPEKRWQWENLEGLKKVLNELTLNLNN